MRKAKLEQILRAHRGENRTDRSNGSMRKALGHRAGWVSLPDKRKRGIPCGVVCHAFPSFYSTLTMSFSWLGDRRRRVWRDWCPMKYRSCKIGYLTLTGDHKVRLTQSRRKRRCASSKDKMCRAQLEWGTDVLSIHVT